MTDTDASHRRINSTYDPITVAFHWLTALVVVSQFSIAQIWELLERGAVRQGLIYTHVALGITFAAILALRILWRLFAGQRTPVQLPRTQRIAADVVHCLLYFLLVAQVVLGFLLGWSAGNPLHFFDLFTVAPLYVVPRDLRHTVGELHDYVAWSIVTLAFVHAPAALLHHYVLHDGVLRSMTRRATGADSHADIA